MSDLREKDYKDIAGWQKHMRLTAQDENLSKSTKRKINYRIGLLDRLVAAARTNKAGDDCE